MASPEFDRLLAEAAARPKYSVRAFRSISQPNLTISISGEAARNVGGAERGAMLAACRAGRHEDAVRRGVRLLKLASVVQRHEPTNIGVLTGSSLRGSAVAGLRAALLAGANPATVRVDADAALAAFEDPADWERAVQADMVERAGWFPNDMPLAPVAKYAIHQSLPLSRRARESLLRAR